MAKVVFWLTFGAACFGMGFFYAFTPPSIADFAERLKYLRGGDDGQEKGK